MLEQIAAPGVGQILLRHHNFRPTPLEHMRASSHLGNVADPMLTAHPSFDPARSQGSILARRRAPRVYVVNSRGDVLMRGHTERALSFDTRSTVTKLLANNPGDHVVLGLTASGELVRIVRLDGEGGPCYAMFLEQLATRSPIDGACKRFGLTEREREVLHHLLRGTSTARIASELMIAESTVATHVRNIGAKMNASKRKEIVAAVLGDR